MPRTMYPRTQDRTVPRDETSARPIRVLVSRSQRDDLMLAVPSGPTLVEPSLARGIELCLEGRAQSLWVDLYGFAPSALTALVQLHLLRPEQDIVLIQRADDPVGMSETLLRDLPQVWLSLPEVPGHMLRMAPVPSSAVHR